MTAGFAEHIFQSVVMIVVVVADDEKVDILARRNQLGHPGYAVIDGVAAVFRTGIVNYVIIAGNFNNAAQPLPDIHDTAQDIVFGVQTTRADSQQNQNHQNRY